MPKSALDLLATKAKLAGAVVLGGVCATAALSTGALSLVSDSSAATAVTCVNPTGTTAPTETASASTEPTASPTDTTCPTPSATVVTTKSPKVEESEAAEATESAEAVDNAKIKLNHATVVSIDATSLVVTAAGATSTWTVSAATRWTGAFKDPAQIKPGMVIHLRGTKVGDVSTATHVVTPGKNKAKQAKPSKAKHLTTKAKKVNGKQP